MLTFRGRWMCCARGQFPPTSPASGGPGNADCATTSALRAFKPTRIEGWEGNGDIADPAGTGAHARPTP